MNVIDPLTGHSKASIGAGPAPTQPGSCLIDDCPNGGGYVTFGGFGNLIVAGDGYAYVPYSYVSVSWPPVCVPQPPVVTAYGTFPQPCRLEPPCATVSGTQYDSAFTGTHYLNLLRIDTSGNASSITLGSWSTSGDCYAGTYAAPTNANVITNADQGTLVTWQLDTGTQGSAGQSKQTTYYVATTSGTSATSPKTMPKQITPVLQAQDGTFYGTDANGNMVKFDQSGNVKWSIPGDSPQIATPNGGVIDIAGTAWDRNGNAIAVVALPVQSWTGLAYTSPLKQIAFVTNPAATPPFWSFANNYLGTSNSGANQSGNSTSPLCGDGRDQIVQQYGQFRVGDAYFPPIPGTNPAQYPQFTPNCFELAGPSPNGPRSANFTFQAISTNQTWALIKYPLVAPAAAGYGLDDWLANYGTPRTITSGYRTPAHNSSVPGAVSNSRHLFGDAVDFQNVTRSETELNKVNKAAKLAGADFVEEVGSPWPCANEDPAKFSGDILPCGHADWRRHDRGKYQH